jgi:hypothetical protein
MNSGFAFSCDMEERKLKLTPRCVAYQQKEPRLAGGAEQRQKASSSLNLSPDSVYRIEGECV